MVWTAQDTHGSKDRMMWYRLSGSASELGMLPRGLVLMPMVESSMGPYLVSLSRGDAFHVVGDTIW